MPADKSPAPHDSDAPPENGGGLARRLFGGIGPRMYLALALAVLLTSTATVVAWMTLREVGDAQREIASEKLPAMNVAFELAQQVNQLVAAVPLFGSVRTDEEREAVRGTVEYLDASLMLMIEQISLSTLPAERIDTLREISEDMTATIDMLDELVVQRLNVERQMRALGEEATAITRRLLRSNEGYLDDLYFYLGTGYRDITDEEAVDPMDRVTGTVLKQYHALSDISIEATRLRSLIGEVLTADDPALLGPLAERIQSAAEHLRRALPATQTPQLETQITPLLALTQGDDGGFALRERYFELLEGQTEQYEQSRLIAEKLTEEMTGLVMTVEQSALAAADRSDSLIGTGVQIMAAVVALSAVGALLIAWLVIGRGLVSRLSRLSAHMRRMAHGELEEPVERKGADEVREMAEALEIFRLNALEVQRLNLVEKLAAEVNAKNVELEKTLEDLRNAQDRIIAQEKLASLGQLTAGIAHEIKNPLNFVNNFASVSVEILDELREVVDEERTKIDEKAADDIDGIIDDLKINLGKINEHGKRADSIVRGMLDHSRQKSGVGEVVPFNKLVEEYVNLAYHGLRGQDRSFNTAIHKDLDAAVGDIELSPQDVSRVVINICNNAFHATEARKKASDASYEPGLWVTTQTHGDGVRLTIRDNGTGMPKHVRDRIFEPFFTTKPTGQGTGLGLSMVFDIIVKMHGGNIDVQTVDGEGTTFILDLPRRMATRPDDRNGGEKDQEEAAAAE